MIETNSQPQNDPIPFAGRHLIYTRLQQHILDPIDHHAVVFSGHDGMGKTAMLRHVESLFRDPILAVYVPLSDTPNTDAVFQSIIAGINQLLEEYQFSLSRVPNINPESDIDLATWFDEIYLKEIASIIRPHRRITFLLDDMEQLLTFEGEFVSYLQTLLEKHPQLTIIGTLSTVYDDKLLDLQPLIDPVKAERIGRLGEEDAKGLMLQHASGVNDDIIKNIFRATGGHPQLLNYFGTIFQHHRADNNDSSAFERAKPDVYAKAKDDFRQIWLKLSRDERLVLTGIASLIYDNPSQVVTAKAIEQWLIETDYAMDIVAINAALRGLDYQDIVSQKQSDGIHLTMGLMQQWLLKQARLDESMEVIKRGRIPLWMIALGAIVIIAIIILLISIPPQYLDNSSVIPTATLRP